eukprot:gene10715-22375_t
MNVICWTILGCAKAHVSSMTLFNQNWRLANTIKVPSHSLPRANTDFASFFEVPLDSSTVFRKEKFSDFLKRSPDVPAAQREYVEEHVAKFEKKISDYYITNGSISLSHSVPFLSLISIGSYNNKFYILDGQHRFMAYNRFYQKISPNRDFYISYSERKCANLDEIKQYFRSLNDHRPMDEIVLNATFADSRETLITYIKKKYSNHISNSDNPKFPNINVDNLVSLTLLYFQDQYNNSEDLISMFEEWNSDIGNTLDQNDLIAANSKQGLYLHRVLKKPPRDSLPKALRNRLWQLKTDEDASECYCCKFPVTSSNFHAGHKIAVAKGGDDDISNLEIVCSVCNLSMGTQDMDIWRMKYFRSRIEAKNAEKRHL